MNHEEGGEGAPLSGLMRLVQGLSPKPRRRGLFGSEYERFMAARRPNSAQMLALADRLQGGGPGGGVASKRQIDAAGGIAAAEVGGEGPAEDALRPVDAMTAQRPIERAALSPIPDRLTRMANGTFDDGSIYFLPIVDRPVGLSKSVPAAERSIEYLAASPVARDAVAGMTVHGVPTNIMQFDRRWDHPGPRDQTRTRFNPADRSDPSKWSASIDWDPTWALRTVDDNGLRTGQVQSPALLWFHEMDHALSALSDMDAYYKRQRNRPGDPYHNLEDRRVITGPERTVAQQLGEPTRTNHQGDDDWTDDDPTFHGRARR